jgi:hypothetical protein
VIFLFDSQNSQTREDCSGKVLLPRSSVPGALFSFQ